MDAPTIKISAVVNNNDRLEFIINKLTEKTVARHDISVQNTSEDVKYTSDHSAIDPKISQEKTTAAKKEAFLQDDFGWVIGFSFSLPLFICVVVAIFVIGDVRSIHDNITHGIAGTIVGVLLGALIAKWVQYYQQQKINKQEAKGGFALWVSLNSDEHKAEVLAMLKEYGATDIQVEHLN